MTIAASSLLQAAAQAAGGQQYPAGALYVVATPIGNLADITLRAIHTLALMDAVACEDTRVSAGLLKHLGLSKPLLALHEHNEQAAAQTVIERLTRGERIAYVSDAGTPAVSDPGAALVAAVQSAGLRAIPLPGASSALAALCVAGDTKAQGFRFVGFLPPKGRERSEALAQALSHGETTVLFEAPHRIASLAQALADTAPDRPITLCRELTKQFESVVTRAARELPAWLAEDANHARGEFVLIVHAQVIPARSPEDAQMTTVLTPLLRELPLKQAVALAVEITGLPRNAVYQYALSLREARDSALDD